MSISDADLWHQVHAQRDDGVAAMFLIRDLEPRVDQPQIFVIQMPYPVTDLSRLPDAAGYRRLDAFQEQWIEPACDALGWTFVASKSEDGSFFLYLYGSGDPSELIEKLSPFDDSLEFFNNRDAEWSEYAALRELVDQAEAADDEDTDGAGHPHIHTDEDDHAGHDHTDHEHTGHEHTGHEHAGHEHADHEHAGHEHADHEHADRDQGEPVVKRAGRRTRAPTVGERPSNIAPARKRAANKPAALAVNKKPAPTRSSATKKPASTQVAGKKPSPTKTAGKKPPPTKTAGKKPPPTKTAGKKPSPTKTAAKKPPPTKTAGKKPSPTKTVAKKRSPTRSARPEPRARRR
jgi:hypothetical protein